VAYRKRWLSREGACILRSISNPLDQSVIYRLRLFQRRGMFAFRHNHKSCVRDGGCQCFGPIWRCQKIAITNKGLERGQVP